jgi:hypothetical protein
LPTILPQLSINKQQNIDSFTVIYTKLPSSTKPESSCNDDKRIAATPRGAKRWRQLAFQKEAAQHYLENYFSGNIIILHQST